MAIMRSIARRAEAHPSRCRAIAPILQRRHPSAAATGLTAHPSTNGSGGGVGGSRNIVQPSVPRRNPAIVEQSAVERLATLLEREVALEV
jgi:hypothetical protein